MKIKLGDALNVNIAIKAILENSQIDTSLKFQLLMIGNALQPVMANYDMLRNQKITELGKQSESEDENGNKNIYIPSYYFTIITNSNTSDVNVNITDTRLSSEQRVRNFNDFNIIDSANLASSGNITLDYTNKTISLNCHLYMCDMFKGIFLIHTISNVSGGVEN